MSRRRVRRVSVGGALLVAALAAVLFGGCVRRMPGANCALQAEMYRREVAGRGPAEGEFLLLAQASEKVRANFVRELSPDNLFMATVRGCNEGCAKELSIEERVDGVRLACGDNAASVRRPIADDRALENAFKAARPVVRQCAVETCRARIDADYEEFLVGTMVRALDRGNSYWACGEIERVRNLGNAQLGLRVAERDGAHYAIAPRKPTPAFKAGIREGDRIVRIGDRSLEEMSPPELRAAEYGVPGSRETVWILRDGSVKPNPVLLTREPLALEDVEGLRLAEGIGYVRIHRFGYQAGDKVAEELRWLEGENGGLKGLVLDVRSNDGGLLQETYAVLDRFIDSGTIGVVKTRAVEPTVQYSKTWWVFRGFPVAVLVNRYTVSGGEMVARALQESGRGTVVGVPTRGSMAVGTPFALRNGSLLWLRTGTAYTGKGSPLDNAAVRPDIVVENGETGDAQLDRAVAYLRDAIGKGAPAAK